LEKNFFFIKKKSVNFKKKWCDTFYQKKKWSKRKKICKTGEKGRKKRSYV